MVFYRSFRYIFCDEHEIFSVSLLSVHPLDNVTSPGSKLDGYTSQFHIRCVAHGLTSDGYTSHRHIKHPNIPHTHIYLYVDLIDIELRVVVCSDDLYSFT